MCKYTYHHDPNCGHIASFNLDTCTAFTSSLRHTESDKRPIACTKTVHNHDLVHPSKPVLCLQCEQEWMEKREAKGKERAEDDSEEEESDYEDGPEFLSLEGLTSPMEAWMMVARPKEQEDHPCENKAIDEGKGESRESLFGLGITTDGKAVADDAKIYPTIHDNGNGNHYDNDGKSPVQSDHTMETPNHSTPNSLSRLPFPKPALTLILLLQPRMTPKNTTTSTTAWKSSTLSPKKATIWAVSWISRIAVMEKAVRRVHHR